MNLIDEALGAIEQGADPKQVKRHYEATLDQEMESAMRAGADYDAVMEKRIELQKSFNERYEQALPKLSTAGKIAGGAKALGKGILTGTETFLRNLDILGTELGIKTFPDSIESLAGFKDTREEDLKSKREALRKVKTEALSTESAQQFPKLTAAGMVAGELLPEVAAGKAAVKAIDVVGKGALAAGKAAGKLLPKGRIAKLNIAEGIEKAAPAGPNPGLLKELGKGIKEGGITGAVVGGLQDPKEDEGRMTERLKQAALGGAVGAAAGGAGSAVIAGIPAMARRLGKPFEEAMRSLRGAAKLEKSTKKFVQHVDPEEQMPGMMERLYTSSSKDMGKIPFSVKQGEGLKTALRVDLTAKGTTPAMKTALNQMDKTNFAGINTLDDLMLFKRKIASDAFKGGDTIATKEALTVQQQLVTKIDDFIVKGLEKEGKKGSVEALKQANYLFKRQLARKNIDNLLFKARTKDGNLDTRKFAKDLEIWKREDRFISDDPYMSKAVDGMIRTVRAQKNLPQILQKYKPRRTSGEELLEGFRADNVGMFKTTARSAMMAKENYKLLGMIDLSDTLFTPKGLRIWYNIGTAQKPTRQIAKFYNYLIGQQAGQITTEDNK